MWKIILLSTLLIVAVPAIATAEDDAPEAEGGPVPCFNITPDRIPPIEIYECPDAAP